jgi:hypothetical protein
VYAPAGIERFWQELITLTQEGRLTPELPSRVGRAMVATEFV